MALQPRELDTDVGSKQRWEAATDSLWLVLRIEEGGHLVQPDLTEPEEVLGMCICSTKTQIPHCTLQTGSLG